MRVSSHLLVVWVTQRNHQKRMVNVLLGFRVKTPIKNSRKAAARRYRPIRPNIEVVVKTREMNHSLESIHEESKQSSALQASIPQDRFTRTRGRFSKKIIQKRQKNRGSTSENLNQNFNQTQTQNFGNFSNVKNLKNSTKANNFNNLSGAQKIENLKARVSGIPK